MEHTTKPRPKHVGRNVRHMRELLKLTQDDIAKKMGVSQQTISYIESSEEVEEEQLDKVAKAMGVTSDALKNLDDTATVYNIVTNQDNATAAFNNYNCTFNPLDKWAQAIEENKKLYERLLKSEQEKVAMMEKMLEGKK